MEEILFLLLFLRDMKFNFLFILFFVISVSFSQGKDAVIKYRQTGDVYFPYQMFCELAVHNNATIYLPKQSTKEYLKAKDQNYFSKQEKVFLDYFFVKVDHENQEVLLFDAFGGNKYLVQDDYQKLNWQITPESKQIGDYQCVKATLNFRGLDWEVWFTPDIPMPYGPWKLYGLPGLIVEAYSMDKVFTWQLEKIEYKESVFFKKDFELLVETKNDKAISLKQFVEDSEEYNANAYARLKQQDPTMAEYTPIRVGFELRYEWEE